LTVCIFLFCFNKFLHSFWHAATAATATAEQPRYTEEGLHRRSTQHGAHGTGNLLTDFPSQFTVTKEESTQPPSPTGYGEGFDFFVYNFAKFRSHRTSNLIAQYAVIM
jgi:hypothetical protein